MDKSIEALLVKQVVLHDKVTSAIENGRKTRLEKRTAGFYKQKLIDIRTLWQECLAQDRRLTETILTLENSAQLPKITLPKFNGEYNSWRSFYDLFTSLVHDNSNLQPVQKLHYLKGCLTGDAERVLRHTPITNQDYLPAWRKLKERYENTRTLVNHQLKTLLSQHKLTTENGKGLKALVDTTEECLQQLKPLKVDTTSWDALLIYLIVQKLPFVTLRLWEEELGDNQNLPQFKTFQEVLHIRIRVLESISNTISAKTPILSSKKEITQTYHTINKSGCPACNGKHYVGNCTIFLNLDTTARRKLIKTAGRCLNCFSSKHVQSKCQNKNRCKKCHELRHTTLHVTEPSSSSFNRLEQFTSSTAVDPQTIQTNNVDKTKNFLTRENHTALLSTALIVAQGRNGHSSILRCLLDSGSQTSFITENACKRLQIRGTQTSITISSLNKSQTVLAKRQVRIQLRFLKSTRPVVETDMLVLKTITDLLPTKEYLNINWEHLQNLEMADPQFWKPGPIDVLLGADIYGQILREGIKRGPEHAPVAINTMFGWIVLGSTATTSSHTQVKTIAVTVNPEDNLSLQIRKFWETEEVPETNIQNPEDKRCQSLYEETHCRLPTGQYQVKLPFINGDAPVLGDSRHLALKRLEYLQKRLDNNQQLKKDYETSLDEYLTLGHMEACNMPTAMKTTITYHTMRFSNKALPRN